MQRTFIPRMRTMSRQKDHASHREADAERRDNDPLAFARGLMNAFALSMLIWILIALALTWMSRG